MDSIGNFLTIIRNGIMLGKRSVITPYSKIAFSIAQVLKEEGFIRDVSTQEDEIKTLKIDLKYIDGESVIHEIKRVSKPSRRYYVNVRVLKPVIGKFGISILTTNKGIVTDKQAKELRVGGEVLCSVW